MNDELYYLEENGKIKNEEFDPLYSVEGMMDFKRSMLLKRNFININEYLTMTNKNIEKKFSMHFTNLNFIKA